MGEERNVYIEPDTRMLLRTADVYQTEQDSPVEEYSDKVLDIVANYRNGGRPDGWNTQSMVGKSKRGEVALRLFADIDDGTRTFRKVGFKTRGCLAMTACASVVCDMVEGKTFAEALAITPAEVEAAVDGVPWDKTHTPLFATEAVKALIGHWMVAHGATLADLDADLPCDYDSVTCIMCEHCSLRDGRTELKMDELMAAAAAAQGVEAAEVAAGETAAVDAEAVSEAAAEGYAAGPVVAAAGGATPSPGAEPASDETPADDASGTEDEAAVHEEARRAAVTHNALASVFDDVRVASADSVLVTPERWVELDMVPDFMTDEDLEMAVYDYLTAWQEEHGRPEDAAGVTFLSSDPLGGQRAAKPKAAGPSAFASRAVGVPAPIIAKKAEPEDDVNVSDEARPQPDEAVAGDAADPEPATATEAATLAPVEIHSALNPDGYAVTRRGQAEAAAPIADDGPDPENPFAGLRIPDGYKLVELEGEWTLVELEPDEIPEKREINCEDIVLLMGAHGYYLYDRTKMTDTFAHWTFLAAEDDPVVTFVYCVREDSRVYPRPMPLVSLKNPPFSMTAEQIEAAYTAASEDADFADIKRTVASNGDVYFYSTEYLSPARADALAEWDAVGRGMNA